ncbi:pimeloyl-ACP methyl ester carboxylesterase [Breoghania corrubedonensis]|uniref:Pimeloyl-ACP methyl ester carboxylesterase n=2 Tax=Breoghania corrubedonensis TaxID=665038 RepID=A0A2T5VBD9_9HYPH|nr:pimeloyl-ACP methyl ester carboxylesterase [Breoghania corrubedonensis]
MFRDPVILIHGAWQGSWAWNSFAPLLEADGFDVFAADLPGNGSDSTDPADVTLDVYLDYFGRLLTEIARPVSLIAHSGGGAIATAVAERHAEQVARIVYVAGMMLPSGASFADVQAEIDGSSAVPSGVTGELTWSADRRVTTVPRAAATAILFSDCAPDLAAAAAAKLTPQGEGGRAIRVMTTPERYGRIPRLYVEATEDRSLLLDVQRRMQQLVPGATVISLPTGHAPHVSAPYLLAEAILPFLQGGEAEMAEHNAPKSQATPLADGASR